MTPGAGPGDDHVEDPHGHDRGAISAHVPIEVLVVAYGAPALLDRCLAAVDRAFPVTVIDNSSRADVRTVATGHGADYVDPGANLGFGAGVNVGLDHLSGGADVLLLNPDAAIDPAGVLGLQRCLHADPGLACVAPDQVDPSDLTRARVGWPCHQYHGARKARGFIDAARLRLCSRTGQGVVMCIGFSSPTRADREHDPRMRSR